MQYSGCIILVPAAVAIEPACEEGLRELERRGYPVRRVHGYAAIDQGRSQMATEALRDGFAETLWIDADIAFHADDVERLRRHESALVGGVYPQKGRRALACHVLPGTAKLTFGAGGGLTEVLYAPTGFLLVRRVVYETIQQQLALPVCNTRFGRPLVPFFQPLVRPDGDGQWYLAEDFSFCERARQCGFSVMIDTSLRLGHVGRYVYTWEDAGGEQPRYKTYHFRLNADT